MANLKSSKKDIRRIARKTERNRHERSTLKTLYKKVMTSAAAEDKGATKDAAMQFVSSLDKAAKKGLVHKNKADRQKGSMAKFIFAAV